MRHNSIPVTAVPFNTLLEPSPPDNEADVTRLAESIATEGVVSPLVVVAHDSGFAVVAGRRRWWAVRRLIADPSCSHWHANALIPVAIVDLAEHAEFV